MVSKTMPSQLFQHSLIDVRPLISHQKAVPLNTVNSALKGGNGGVSYRTLNKILRKYTIESSIING